MRLPEDFGRRLVIAVALVSAGFLAAWLRFRPFLENESVYTDGTASYRLSQLDRLRFAIWEDPEPLPPWINTPEAESGATLSPDGTQLVFVAGETGLNADLFVADMVGGQPVGPRPLERLNSAEDELAPAFDGESLWFASNRGGGAGGYDLWRASWDDGRFGSPEWIGGGVNSRANETDPAPVPGAAAITFSSDRARGARSDYDLYIAVPEGAGEDRLVRRLDELNSPFDEREPAYTAEGSGLVFASDREGEGGFDLWRSVQRQGAWLEPVPLPGLNGPTDERSPRPLDDGFGLYFARATEAGDLDLQRARSLELTRVPGRPVGWWELTLLGLLLLLALLTWLGKRWEALDILAKCLLVSLLVHGALLWWFRDVPVGGDGVELPDAPPTFSVQLSARPNKPAATLEREGKVQAERSQEPVAQPSRQASARQSVLAERSENAQTVRLTGPTLSTAPAPSPSVAAAASAPAPQPVDARLPDVQLNAVSESSPSLALAAPTLEVRPSAARSAMPTELPVAHVPSRSAATQVAVTNPTSATLHLPSTTRAVVTPTVARASPPSQTAALSAQAATPSVSGATQQSRELVLQPTRTNASSSAVAQAAPAPVGLDLTPAPVTPSTAARAQAPRRLTAPSTSSAATGSVAPGSAVAPGVGGAISLGSVATGEPPARRPLTAAAPTRRQAGVPIRVRAPGSETAPRSVASAPAPSAMAMPVPTALPVKVAPRPEVQPPGRRTPVAVQGTQRTTTLPERGPAYTPLPEPVQAAMVAAAPTPKDSPWEATPYQSRVGDAKERALVEFGGGTETEAAVANGLAYLARLQSNIGHWGDENDYDSKYGHVAIGKTALCLLAFLGAGHVPGGDTQYGATSQHAVDFLLAQQDEHTGHFGYSTSYSHGVTTYALAECYALTGEERLRQPLERAVRHILNEQNKEPDARRFGGWGYYYPDGRIYDPWPRSSITAWQVMALESARLGGLEVPDQAFADARRFLTAAHRRDRGVILYSHDPSRIRSRYWTLPGSTPAGLFALSILGEDLRDETYRSTIDYVRERAPDGFRSRGDDAFVLRASGNLYFWYYGSLMLLRHGGRAWRVWNEDMQETLLPSQQPDGSWKPISLYADYAGDDDEDRSYTTAMCVLTLEVYYRYFTPLLKVK